MYNKFTLEWNYFLITFNILDLIDVLMFHPECPSRRKAVSAYPSLSARVLPATEMIHYIQVMPSFPGQPVSLKQLGWGCKVLPPFPQPTPILSTLKDHFSFKAPTGLAEASVKIASEFSFPLYPYRLYSLSFLSLLFHRCWSQEYSPVSLFQLSVRVLPRELDLKYRTHCFT